MRRRVPDPRVAVLRHFAAAGLALLIGSAGAFAQSGNPGPQDQPARRRPPMPADVTKDNQRKTDEFVEAAAGHQRPGRKPGMRLARPPRGAPDVARRPRYRLPPPRPLRPVRLPRRPCPGDLPLPDPFWRPDRPQGAEKPDSRVHACWINPGAQPQAAAARQLRAPATAGNAAPAPAARPRRLPAPAPGARRRNSRPRIQDPFSGTIRIIRRLDRSLMTRP